MKVLKPKGRGYICCMRRICLVLFIILTIDTAVSANTLYDSATKTPIGNAKVTVPKYNYSTYTDENGNFDLGEIKDTTIMSVKKEGYKPFSLTVNNDIVASKPLVVGIQKSDVSDIVIEENMIHLGDDNYSLSSANAGYFRLQSVGPSYTKQFIMKNAGGNNFLVIGSIVGIDTRMARAMGQNRIINSYASPPEVYFNGRKISEIQLNGDNQKVRIPNNLIRLNAPNEVTIRTGRNLMQTMYIDYDDIEIANISVQSE